MGHGARGRKTRALLETCVFVAVFALLCSTARCFSWEHVEAGPREGASLLNIDVGGGATRVLELLIESLYREGFACTNFEAQRERSQFWNLEGARARVRSSGHVHLYCAPSPFNEEITFGEVRVHYTADPDPLL